MTKVVSALIAILLMPTALEAWAVDDAGLHLRQRAHQHGLAKMTLVLEGNRGELQLESPAINIVGFERKASSDEERRRVEQARRNLESHERLFSFMGTRCEIGAFELDVSAVLETQQSEHNQTTREHRHDEAGRNATAHETHSEVSARYEFYCEQGSSLAAVSLNVFELFPGIETLQVMWVSDRGQGSAELTRKSKTIHLRGTQ